MRQSGDSPVRQPGDSPITALPPDAVESPRPPQRVKVGLTGAERQEMRNWFPRREPDPEESKKWLEGEKPV